LIGASLGVLALAVGLMLFALRGSIVFFNSPTDIASARLRRARRSASAAW